MVPAASPAHRLTGVIPLPPDRKRYFGDGCWVIVKIPRAVDNYVSGGALASNRSGDRTSIDPHESQLTAEVDSVTNEEEARCRGMLLAAPHERNAVGIEDTEVADQLVQATTVAGRRDTARARTLSQACH